MWAPLSASSTPAVGEAAWWSPWAGRVLEDHPLPAPTRLRVSQVATDLGDSTGEYKMDP